MKRKKNQMVKDTDRLFELVGFFNLSILSLTEKEEKENKKSTVLLDAAI